MLVTSSIANPRSFQVTFYFRLISTSLFGHTRSIAVQDNPKDVPIVVKVDLGGCGIFCGSQFVVHEKSEFKRLPKENRSGQCEKYKIVFDAEKEN
jgi:hypothetical protein